MRHLNRIILTALVVFSVSALFAEEPTITEPEPVALESLAGEELEVAVRDALRRWRTTSRPQAEEAAREFLQLYHALQNDTLMQDKSRTRFTKTVRGKLNGLSKQIAKSVELGEAQSGTLGQFNAPGGMNPGGGNNAADDAKARAQESGEQLVELIQETIRPDTWDAGGGTGTIQYWNTNGSLIIRQTDEVHEEVQSLLEQLRRAGS